MYHFGWPCRVQMDYVVNDRNLFNYYIGAGPTTRQGLHSSRFMPITDAVSFFKMMRDNIPVKVHFLSDSCVAQTFPGSEIRIDHQISKLFNISTITIVIILISSTVLGSIDQIHRYVCFLPCHQYI